MASRRRSRVVRSNRSLPQSRSTLSQSVVRSNRSLPHSRSTLKTGWPHRARSRLAGDASPSQANFKFFFLIFYFLKSV